MIVLGIIAWVLCAAITYGVLMHVDPDEMEDDPLLGMFICVLIWPLFILIGIGIVILSRLSKIGMFFAGLIDKLFEKKEEQDG